MDRKDNALSIIQSMSDAPLIQELSGLASTCKRTNTTIYQNELLVERLSNSISLHLIEHIFCHTGTNTEIGV